MILALLVLLAPLLLPAQSVVSARAGLIYFVEGEVTLDGASAIVKPPTGFPQIEVLQKLETRTGRAEVLLGQYAVLWLAQDSQLRFEDTSLEATLVAIERGAAIVEVRDLPKGDRLQLRLGEAIVRLADNGVYRFEAQPARLRVYGGEALVAASADPESGAKPLKVKGGKEVALTGAFPVTEFDSGIHDEFHHWAAYRSYQLQAETRSNRGPSNWQFSGRSFTRHRYFGVEYRSRPAAAALQYLTNHRAGVVFYTEGRVSGNGVRGLWADDLSPYLSEQSFVRTGRGRAEVLLGTGVVVWMGPETQLRLLDSEPANAAIALERGSLMIEVADNPGDARARVQFGDAMTELAKPGIYRFDAREPALRVYSGEALTRLDERTFKTKGETMLDLAMPREAVKFERDREEDALYFWARSRSLALYLSAGDVMTDWAPTRFASAVWHPEFGTIPVTPASRGRGRR